MSDQDFFSEGEETEADRKVTKANDKGAKATPAKSSANRPAAKSGSGSTAAKSSASKAPQAQPSFFDQSVTMAMAILLAVVGLLLGVIVGYFVFSGGGSQSTAVAPGSFPTPSTTGTGTAAPPLTQDQLNKGQLPAGHPKVGGSTTPTPAK